MSGMNKKKLFLHLFYFGFLLACILLYLNVHKPATDKSPASWKVQERTSHVTGLVLARCGSKGIRMKNLVKIGTQSLLQRTLMRLHASKRFGSVWVATDCNAIAEEAFQSGAQVFWRSPESATDTAPSIVAVKEFVDKNPNFKYVALFQCTSPFLELPFIHSAFDLVNQGYDSVFSVHRQFKLRWQVEKDGHVKAANFDPAFRPRRQDWSGELVENGMFYFIERDLLSKGLLQGGRIGVVEIPANCSLEIDTQADLDVAVALVASATTLHSLAQRGGGSSSSGGPSRADGADAQLFL